MCIFSTHPPAKCSTAHAMRCSSPPGSGFALANGPGREEDLTCWLLSSTVATSAAVLHPALSHQPATASCPAGAAGSASQIAAQTARQAGAGRDGTWFNSKNAGGRGRGRAHDSEAKAKACSQPHDKHGPPPTLRVQPRVRLPQHQRRGRQHRRAARLPGRRPPQAGAASAGCWEGRSRRVCRHRRRRRAVVTPPALPHTRLARGGCIAVCRQEAGCCYCQYSSIQVALHLHLVSTQPAAGQRAGGRVVVLKWVHPSGRPCRPRRPRPAGARPRPRRAAAPSAACLAAAAAALRRGCCGLQAGGCPGVGVGLRRLHHGQLHGHFLRHL